MKLYTLSIFFLVVIIKLSTFEVLNKIQTEKSILKFSHQMSKSKLKTRINKHVRLYDTTKLLFERVLGCL